MFPQEPSPDSEAVWVVLDKLAWFRWSRFIVKRLGTPEGRRHYKHLLGPQAFALLALALDPLLEIPTDEEFTPRFARVDPLAFHWNRLKGRRAETPVIKEDEEEDKRKENEFPIQEKEEPSCLIPIERQGLGKENVRLGGGWGGRCAG